MGIIEEEFSSSFHSLSGVTLGERRKNLRHLLKKTRQSLEASSCQINFSTLHPTTPLEQSFKVEALIYFRKVPELVEVLKSDDPVLIEKVLKSGAWFVEEISKSVSGQQLVEDLFPHISYNTKLKLMNKLSLHLKKTQRADEFFEAIKGTYGLYLAAKILPACSGDLIMKHLGAGRIEVTPRQLMTIIRKYPSLTESVFGELYNYNGEIDFTDKYRHVFGYLKRCDLSLFLKLKEQYKSDVLLGSRTTLALIRTNKQDVVAKPAKFYEMMKKNRISQGLKTDFNSFFLNLLPKSVQQFKGNLSDFLALLSLKDSQKLKFLEVVFKTKYGVELWDCPEMFSLDLIAMMSPNERETWMQTRTRPSEISEVMWIALMKTSKSIPLLKEKITLTSKILQRIALVSALVKTCVINDDVAALLEVCRYMLDYHRNDHLKIRQMFVKTLSSFDLIRVQSEHWKCIFQFIDIFGMNNEYCYGSKDIFEMHIQYCYVNELPLEEHLTNWIKSRWGQYIVYEQKPEVTKHCLILFDELIPKIYKEDELKRQYVAYLELVDYWNTKHPNDEISLFTNNDAINAVKSELIGDSHYKYKAINVAVKCIVSNYKQSKESGLFDVFLREKLCNKEGIINLLLRQDPEVFGDYTDAMMEHIFGAGLSHTPCYIRNLCRNYTHIRIPQRIATICLERMQMEDMDGGRRKLAAVILSQTNPESFLDLVAKYPPLNLSAGLCSDERLTYKYQQALLPTLRKVIPPSLALNGVLHFCKSDYVPLIQRSLYSLALNINEKRLVQFFNALNDHPDSIKKHSIYLAFKVLSKAGVYTMLTDLTKSSTSSPIRKSIFKAVFNFFIRNPDDYWWDLTKQSVKEVDINDKEAFNVLSRYKRIPSRYMVRYVVFTWDILENFAKPDGLIDGGKCRILDALTTTVIPKLPNELSAMIVKKYLFQLCDDSNLHETVQSFSCRYAICGASDTKQEECVKLVFAILKNHITTTRGNIKTDISARKTVFNFVQKFCSHFLTDHVASKAVNIFSTLWNNFFKPHEAIDEYLYLQFTLMYLDCCNEKVTVSHVGEKFATFCDSLPMNLSMNIFYGTLDWFRSFFLSLTEGDRFENEMVLVESILKSSSSTNCLVLATMLLPHIYLVTPEIGARYEETIRVLANKSDPIVQMHLHHYLVQK